MHDLLTTHGIGRACIPESAESLAEAIRELARSPETCREMGQRARRHAEAHLEKDAILGEFESKLGGLVSMKGAA
jgi:colanic acid biosynthesis glycosyl transferase WcaI